jgi:hypothetical protein
MTGRATVPVRTLMFALVLAGCSLSGTTARREGDRIPGRDPGQRIGYSIQDRIGRRDAVVTVPPGGTLGDGCLVCRSAPSRLGQNREPADRKGTAHPRRDEIRRVGVP